MLACLNVLSTLHDILLSVQVSFLLVKSFLYQILASLANDFCTNSMFNVDDVSEASSY